MSDVERCDDCGRRLDRPGHRFCRGDRPHAEPTLAQSIVEGVESELNGRHGMGFDDIDPDIQDDIRDRLAEIIEAKLKEAS